MARKIIDTGTLGNPATGDSLRTAMTKINTNFEELFISNAADGQLTTTVTNGDISIQPNGTGTVEIDALSVNSDNITSLTTNSSVTITGNGTAGVDIEGISVNGTTISSSDSSTININENLQVDGTGTFQSGATIDGVSITDNTITTSASNANLELTASGTGAVKVDAILSLPDGSDSDNYVGVGADDDLKIFHNGSHSIIRETGTGNLFLQSDNNVIIGKDASSETMIKGVADGAVELYHDNTKKLETSATGVAVTGTLDIDGGISITDNTITTSASNADLELNASGSGTIVLENLKVGTGATVTTILDEDDMSSDSATALATQQSIKAYVLAQGGSTGAMTFSGNTMSTASNADIEITPGGTGNVNLNGDTVRVGDNDANATITTQGTGDLTLSTNGGTDSGTIKITDAANGDITLETDGTGDILLKAGGQVGIGTVSSPDTDLHIKKPNAVITLQRTTDSNQPGIDFQQSGGNVRAKLRMDGTSGTSNEVFVETFDGASLAERFRVTHTGAKVSGTLNVDDGISITDNIITTSASNADLELKASGTGSVSIDGIQISGTELSSSDSTQITIKENLHVTGNISGTITGTVTGTIDADSSTISNLEVDNFKAATIVTEGEGIGSNDNDTTIPTSAAVKDFVDSNPTTSLAADNLTIGDAAINITNTSGDITLDTQSPNRDIIFKGTKNGTDLTVLTLDMSEGGAAVFRGVTINDNTILSNQSNDNLELDAAGTGQVVAKAAFKFNAGYIENINTLTSSSTITVDCSLASIHKVTLGVSTEFNITNLPTGGTVTLIITQDGTGSRTATFGTDGSTAVKFPGGAPTLSTGANDIDVVTIVNDGTNFLGNCAKNYS